MSTTSFNKEVSAFFLRRLCAFSPDYQNKYRPHCVHTINWFVFVMGKYFAFGTVETQYVKRNYVNCVLQGANGRFVIGR